MNKPALLKITNALLFISMAIQIVTGVILFFELFIIRARLFEAVIQIHRYNGVLFAILMVMHLTLNWSWVKSQFFKGSAV